MNDSALMESGRVLVPRHFWSQVASAPHRVLILDYDETIAPFAAQAGAPADLAGRIIDRLRRIAQTRECTVAAVSGRPLRDIDAVLDQLPIHATGEHGFETRFADGRSVVHSLPREWSEALARAVAAATARGWRDRLECTRSSVVLRTGSDESPRRKRDLGQECTRLWADLALAAGLRLVETKGGIDLRAPGRHKGTAVQELMMRAPAGALAVYVGDDAAEPEAFREVRFHGFGIAIGSASRTGLAGGALASREDLLCFLEQWERCVDRAPAELAVS
jgi:trehalose 6-phosphate phosphatase